jgi:hypothetical protein
MPIFSEQLNSTFAMLARPLMPEDGLPEATVADAEARLGVRLPAVLRSYYRLAGRFDQFNLAHNRLLRPDEWFVADGRLVFLEENQHVVFWGVEAGASPEDDPPVDQGPNDDGRPAEWSREHGRCSEFLLVMLHLQAVWGGYEFLGGGDIAAEVVGRFPPGWTPAGRVGNLQAFGREGGAACVLEGEDSPQVFVGGRTERDFEAIVAELGEIGVEIDEL